VTKEDIRGLLGKCCSAVKRPEETDALSGARQPSHLLPPDAAKANILILDEPQTTLT